MRLLLPLPPRAPAAGAALWAEAFCTSSFAEAAVISRARRRPAPSPGGRARRARELKKVVLAEERGGAAAGTRTVGGQGWQKVEASDAFLLGRVSVLSAREFDSRRGYCGRDPDVYTQHCKFSCHGPGIPQLADGKVGRQRLLAVCRAQSRSGVFRC